MANTKSNVSVGKPKIGGAIWRAASGTTLPTDATSTLSGSFACLGYISGDGLSNNNSKEHSEIKAWGGDVVAIPMTGHSDTFKATFIECLNSEVLKAAHGADNVSGSLSSGISIAVNGEDDIDYVYVVDMVLNKTVKKRIVIPAGMVTEVGEVVYKDDDTVGYPITITALPDESENTHYEYIKQASGT